MHLPPTDEAHTRNPSELEEEKGVALSWSQAPLFHLTSFLANYFKDEI